MRMTSSLQAMVEVLPDATSREVRKVTARKWLASDQKALQANSGRATATGSSCRALSRQAHGTCAARQSPLGRESDRRVDRAKALVAAALDDLEKEQTADIRGVG